MVAIGDPESYVAVIRDGSDPATAYTEQAPILRELKWSKLQWGRVTSDVSTSTVTVPWDDSGGNCQPGDLQGWDRVISIYRNGDLQWQGPIVGWTTDANGGLDIAAHDLFAWTKKRLIAADYSAAELDAMSLWDALVLDVLTASSETVPWTLIRPTSVGAGSFGIKVTRDYRYSELRNLYEVISQLRDDIDFFFTALPGSAFYDDGDLYRSTKPALNTSTVVDMVRVTVDCLEIADHVYFGEDGAGPSGYANVDVIKLPKSGLTDYSVYDQDAVALEPVGAGSLAVASSTTKARHLKALALRCAPTTTIEQITIGPKFGAGVYWFNGLNTLTPGLVADWQFPFAPLSVPVVTLPPSARLDWYIPGRSGFLYSASSNQVRLTEVSVTVETGDEGEASEVISASFVPWGGE